MPVFDYLCQCGHHSDRFVWYLNDMVFCPNCGKPMKRLFTDSIAELKSKRSKPRSYSYEFKECNAKKDLWETCKIDYKHGRTDERELNFWKKKVKEENPNLVI